MISVVIPVGPAAIYRPYLQECLDSLKVQTQKPDEVLLVDDMAHLQTWNLDVDGLNVRVHENAWNLGNPASKNVGVALAKNFLSILIGSDDKLLPWAVADCADAWNNTQDIHAYYWMDVQYDNGECQSLPCGGAMVSKALWEITGGFPIKSVVGADDSIFLDLLTVRGLANLRHVKSKEPPIWCRRHPGSLTSRIGAWWHVIPKAREIIVAEWEKPTWT